MSELAALLPWDVRDVNHVTLAASKSVYNDGYDWVVRVQQRRDMRGYVLRRYKSATEAELATTELRNYINAVVRLTT